MTEINPYQEIIFPSTYLAKGDDSAFAAIYNNYYSRIWYYSRRLVTDPDVASDITSDTFIKLWKAEHDFPAVQQVEAFLHITARNAALNYLKQVARKKSIHTELEQKILQETTSNALAYDVTTELLELIFQEVQQLPAKYHKVFELAFIQGYKNEEIAELLKLSNQTVRTYKKEMVQKLKNVFEDKELLLLLFFLAGGGS